jgi:hypothetical protein
LIEAANPLSLSLGRRVEVDPDGIGIFEVVNGINLQLIQTAIVKDEYV